MFRFVMVLVLVGMPALAQRRRNAAFFCVGVRRFTGTLRRSDFGMEAWKSVVGDEVTLIIEVEAQRGGDDAAVQ